MREEYGGTYGSYHRIGKRDPRYFEVKHYRAYHTPRKNKPPSLGDKRLTETIQMSNPKRAKRHFGSARPIPDFSKFGNLITRGIDNFMNFKPSGVMKMITDNPYYQTAQKAYHTYKHISKWYRDRRQSRHMQAIGSGGPRIEYLN